MTKVDKPIRSMNEEVTKNTSKERSSSIKSRTEHFEKLVKNKKQRNRHEFTPFAHGIGFCWLAISRKNLSNCF